MGILILSSFRIYLETIMNTNLQKGFHSNFGQIQHVLYNQVYLPLYGTFGVVMITFASNSCSSRCEKTSMCKRPRKPSLHPTPKAALKQNEQTYSLQLTDSVFQFYAGTRKQAFTEQAFADGQILCACMDKVTRQAGARSSFPRTDIGSEPAGSVNEILTPKGQCRDEFCPVQNWLKCPETSCNRNI